jgi:hypothetical protein
MRKGSINSVIGVIVSLFLFVFGIIFIRQTMRIVVGGEKTSGQVVDSEARNGRNGKVYASVIEFQTKDGRKIRFTSPASSSLRPKIGSQIPVIYQPTSPDQAMVYSFWHVYGSHGTYMAFCVLFLLLSLWLPIRTARQHRKIQRLQSSGRFIQAKLIGAAKLGTIMNGVTEYEISAQWTDPSTNILHQFKSFPLSSDPTLALQGKTEITVYLNPSDFKDYWMDTSFT